jgi:ABC-type uncharacterized transport system substrate-binding protein
MLNDAGKAGVGAMLRALEAASHVADPVRHRRATLHSKISTVLVFAAVALLSVSAARAHPHVWIITKAEITFAPDGKVTGVRHRWTFDLMISAAFTQGLDTNGDGQFTSDELKDLARQNTESLVAYDYYTVLNANGAKQAFDAPRDAAMVYEKNNLILSFLLPLKSPLTAGKVLALEVNDPTFFVAFMIATGDDAAQLVGAPKGCVATVTRPKPVEATPQKGLSESFFDTLNSASGFGAQSANRILVACP